MNNVEDIYPLAPMQELMLLHSLRRGGSDLLLDQACYTLRGHRDVAVFHNSWQRIVDRHPALRTAFLWDDLKQPLQVVRREVELPLQEFDFRGLSRDEQASRLEDYLRSDRRRGFQLFQAPLMRLALFRLTSDETHFICSSHHLILDRWCIAIIHDELSKLYDVRARGEPEDLDRPTPYRDYVAWVQRQDLNAAKDFWRKSLAGFVTATLLTTGMNGDLENGDTQSLRFSERTTSALREFARKNSLTLGSLFRAAWAMVLSEMTGRYDLVFGITVVGRPPDLAGVESIVGSFINNLPVRVRLDPARSLVDVLREMQAYQQRMRRFEFISLAKVHEWSDLPENQALFDTLFVHLASIDDPQDMHDGMQMRAIPGALRPAAPLTVVLEDVDPQIRVRISCHGSLPDEVTVSDILHRLRSKLDVLHQQPRCRVGDVIRVDASMARSLSSRREFDSPTTASIHRGPSRHAPAARERRTTENMELETLTQQLIMEWREILGVQTIDVHTSFFELGGTSIQAVRLHSRVQTLTRKAVPLVPLFMSPTIEEMARLLHTKQWPACPDPVAAIQPQGSRPPLFCIATPEANAIGYTALARHLGKDQPLYLIQSPPESKQPARLTPDELTRSVVPYLEAIRSVQSTGPYHLTGMCWGAYLAFEIAEQLTKCGETMAFLGILDTWSKYTQAPLTPMLKFRRSLSYYANRLRTFSRLDLRAQLSDVRNVATRKITAFRNGIANWIPEPSLSEDELGPWHEYGWEKPGLSIDKYDGCVTVFRRRKQPFTRIRDPQLGWGQFAERVEIRMLTCNEDYTAILREPYVKDLAVKIKACLDDLVNTTERNAV